MFTYPLSGLYALAALIAWLSYMVCRRYLSTSWAVALSIGKIAVPLTYFTWWFDGTWTQLDDVNYWHSGRALLLMGFNPATELLTSSGFSQLESLSNGTHFVYQWWSSLLFYLFGPFYYVPVLWNVLWSFVAGLYLYSIIRECGLAGHYARLCTGAFLLAPSVIAWSSFMNMRDTMIMALATMAQYHLIILARRPNVRSTIIIAAICVVMLDLRFYVPLALLGSFVAFFTIEGRTWARFCLAPACAAAGAYYAYGEIQKLGLNPNGQSFFAIGQVGFGLAHMLFTPRPWELAPYVSFLYIPAIANWALSPFLAIGIVSLWQRARPSRQLLLYAGLLLLVYSLTPYLQGYRQRYQLDPILVWARLEGVIWVAAQLRRKFAESAGTRPGAGARPWAAANLGS